ncbi:MAG: hypothetical protein JJU11_07010 [Candidatus Sumerlaeia bacterium]|nr:hypothetical protein [Candidatus Sumerlaeia bacterium]
MPDPCPSLSIGGMDPTREQSTSFAPTPPWIVAVVGVSVALSLYTARKAGICVDDAFITATYARNLATGHGMVFNTGEYILGVTTPLWCLLQAAVMLVAPFAREGVWGMMALAFGAHVWAGVALAFLAARIGAGWWGWLAPVGWIFMPHHVSLFGMEYGLATALAATVLLLFFAGRALWCGIFCSMLALTRPEAALLPIMLFGVLLGRRQWHQAIRFAIPVAVVGITTLTLFQLYYGSPVPNTFGAKRMQLANREEFVWLQSVGRGAWQYLLVEILRGALVQALLLIFGLLGIIATF